METYECPYALCMNLKKIIWNEKTIEKKMEFLSCTNNIIKKVAKRRIYIKKNVIQVRMKRCQKRNQTMRTTQVYMDAFSMFIR